MVFLLYDFDLNDGALAVANSIIKVLLAKQCCYLCIYDTTDAISCLSQNRQLFCSAFVHERVVFFATGIIVIDILMGPQGIA
ncbi:MAG: hypothetical protein C0392_03195 [Syntrophus sp. (in: bacteria)]|nr:hypothetical protein [Syntrophus sp. (in: bacteria)]